ncbi:hypothetical protein C8Q80DRAFT_1072723, partial [Daedaleopsis nitida]
PACKPEPETVKHFLLSCLRFAGASTRHLVKLGHRAHLLGFLLGDQAATKARFAHINDTGRLRGTYGDL